MAVPRRKVLSQTAELKYLCEMFSNLDVEEVKKTWADARRDVTRSVELLSAMSDAKRRQVQVVNSPVPLGMGSESMMNEDGAMECLICFGVGIDALLLPCQHSGLCSVCAEAVLRRNPPLCPMCRMYVSEVIRFVHDPTAEATLTASTTAAVSVGVTAASSITTDSAAAADAPASSTGGGSGDSSGSVGKGEGRVHVAAVDIQLSKDDPQSNEDDSGNGAASIPSATAAGGGGGEDVQDSAARITVVAAGREAGRAAAAERGTSVEKSVNAAGEKGVDAAGAGEGASGKGPKKSKNKKKK